MMWLKRVFCAEYGRGPERGTAARRLGQRWQDIRRQPLRLVQEMHRNFSTVFRRALASILLLFSIASAGEFVQPWECPANLSSLGVKFLTRLHHTSKSRRSTTYWIRNSTISCITISLVTIGWICMKRHVQYHGAAHSQCAEIALVPSIHLKR